MSPFWSLSDGSGRHFARWRMDVATGLIELIPSRTKHLCKITAKSEINTKHLDQIYQDGNPRAIDATG